MLLLKFQQKTLEKTNVNLILSISNQIKLFHVNYTCPTLPNGRTRLIPVISPYFEPYFSTFIVKEEEMEEKKTVSVDLKNKKFVDAGPSNLANKAGEPPLKLYLSLNKIEFKCTEDRKPSCVRLKMFNPLNEMISFKVRCTSADIFRVQPPLGFVKPQDAIEIIFWYQNQDKKDVMAKNHYFAFYHTISDGRTAKELWTNAKIDGVRRLPALFLKDVK